MMKGKYSYGMSLVEVVIAATVITVFMAALVGLYSLHMRVILSNPRQVKATFLAEETLEAVKYMRNVSWAENIAPLSLDTDYYLVWQSGKWSTSTENILIDDQFERRVVLEEVERGSNNDIVESGGTPDPDARKVTAYISWMEAGATTTKSISTYLTDLFEN